MKKRSLVFLCGGGLDRTRHHQGSSSVISRMILSLLILPQLLLTGPTARITTHAFSTPCFATHRQLRTASPVSLASPLSSKTKTKLTSSSLTRTTTLSLSSKSSSSSSSEASSPSSSPTTTAASSSSRRRQQTRAPGQLPLSMNQRQLDAVTFKNKFPRTWVPLASIYELDPDRPTPVMFLGQRYVVYRSATAAAATNSQQQQQPTQSELDNDPNHDPNTEQWVVLDDACPHRLAPLSEGRIEKRTNKIGDNVGHILECSYHGWQFNATGHNVCIPQMTASQAKTTQTKADPVDIHLKSYPTQLWKNVLWAWLWSDDVLSSYYYEDGDGDGSNQQMSQAAKNPKQPQWMVPDHIVPDDSGTYTRDLPYGWDMLLENIVDPSHVPFAHHGLQGSREDAIPINLTITQKVSSIGFDFEVQDRTMGMLRNSHGSFLAPFVVQYDGRFAEKGKPPFEDETAAIVESSSDSQEEETSPPRFFNLTVVMIPTKPGWSRAIILGASTKRLRLKEKLKEKQQQQEDQNKNTVTTKKKKPQQASLLRVLFAALPTWVMHLFSNQFLDSDLAFVHYQEQERMSRQLLRALETKQQSSSSEEQEIQNLDDEGDDGGSAGGAKEYFMPATADLPIRAIRKWIGTFAHIPGPLPPPISDRTVLFDRWSQHTEHCRHCRSAYNGLQTLKTRTYIALGVIVGLSPLLLATTTTTTLGVEQTNNLLLTVPAILVVVCLGLLRLVTFLEDGFKEGGFNHFEND